MRRVALKLMHFDQISRVLGEASLNNCVFDHLSCRGRKRQGQPGWAGASLRTRAGGPVQADPTSLFSVRLPEIQVIVTFLNVYYFF